MRNTQTRVNSVKQVVTQGESDMPLTGQRERDGRDCHNMAHLETEAYWEVFQTGFYTHTRRGVAVVVESCCVITIERPSYLQQEGILDAIASSPFILVLTKHTKTLQQYTSPELTRVISRLKGWPRSSKLEHKTKHFIGSFFTPDEFKGTDGSF